jgi:hypothetical protein
MACGRYRLGVPLFRIFTLFMLLYRMWRRLPPSQRRRALKLAGRHGPRVASHVARRAVRKRA